MKVKEKPIPFKETDMWMCFKEFFNCEDYDCPHYNQCNMMSETGGGYY